MERYKASELLILTLNNRETGQIGIQIALLHLVRIPTSLIQVASRYDRKHPSTSRNGETPVIPMDRRSLPWFRSRLSQSSLHHTATTPLQKDGNILMVQALAVCWNVKVQPVYGFV